MQRILNTGYGRYGTLFVCWMRPVLVVWYEGAGLGLRLVWLSIGQDCLNFNTLCIHVFTAHNSFLQGLTTWPWG